MKYTVKEMYYTLQGEGRHTGRAAIFCRFTGCNLWSGREEDRSEAICRFCDTDFIGTDGPGGGRFEAADELAAVAASMWPTSTSVNARPLIVCTGGEPLLQLNEELVGAFHRVGFEIAIETNGTRLPPVGIDWVCVSPKAEAELILRSGDELKLVFPQSGAEPEMFQDLNFKFFFLQPMDGPAREENTQLAVQYCLSNPRWRLSLQTHKLLGIR